MLKRYLSPAGVPSREDRGAPKRSAQFDMKDTKPPIRFKSDSPRDTSPRTCYSLELDRSEKEGGDSID